MPGETCSGLVATLLAIVLSLCAAPMHAAGHAPSIERLASLPQLTGTPPTAPAFSPDSSKVAFLWNDRGEPFLDVWIASSSGDDLRRLTTFGAARAPLRPFDDHDGDDLSLAALSKAAAERHDPGVSEVIWGPGGERVFFVYEGGVHAATVATGELERIADGPSSPAALSISPSKRFLAFLMAGDLWLKDLESGFLVQATKVGKAPPATLSSGRFFSPDVGFDSYAWSADSDYIAVRLIDKSDARLMPVPSYITRDEPFLNEVRRPYPGDEGIVSRVGLYRLSDGVVRYLDLAEPNNRNILNLEWSPSAARLLIQQDSHEGEHRWLHVATADGSVKEILYDHRPRRIYSVFNAAWSADGERIVYVDDNEGYYALKTISPDGGRSRQLTRGAGDVSSAFSRSPVIVPDGDNAVFYTSSARSPYERHVYRVPISGGSPERITTMQGVHGELAVSADGRYIAVVASNDTTPSELYVKRVGGDDPERRVTKSPPDEFYEYDWVQPRYVSFPSRIDDFELHARIIEPPNLDRSRKYPVIIGNVYSNSVRNAWTAPRQISALQQTMVIDGEYIVVQVDLRGSIGYGVDFREAFQGDWGGGDLEDLHSTVDWLKTLPYVDPNRIGIWGNSYGGMMVLFALFEKPGMFAAGVAGAPAIDVHRFTGNDQHLSRRPQTHPEIFLQSTLLNYGEKLEDPLMFIHGLHDDIVPIRTTLQMMEKLLLLGKDFDVAVMPTSSHWWAYPEHYAVYTFGKIMQFFDRHLK